jgi:hypothetical protein
MQTFTRVPRVLVKLPARAAGQELRIAAALPFGARTRDVRIDVRLERLFESIPPRAAGLGAASPGEWHVLSAAAAGSEVNAWDLCHSLVREGFGVAGLDRASFAEPDLEQRWVTGTAVEHALAAAGRCERPSPADSRLPNGGGDFWFRDARHSQLQAAREAVGAPADRVRIAHLDTGYDPRHKTLPQFLRQDLQKNFVEADRPDDATDHTAGVLTNLGHGTGTLGILAGNVFAGSPLGGAPLLDVVPVRVANSVVLFRNSAIAKAFDYVHQLVRGPDPTRRVQVVTMSMGGLASQAWADAVNALYEAGVLMVTAAGNNFGNLPTRFIVFPARFKRVVAVCGAMADSRPYADLSLSIMAGNYGPRGKMATAMAAWTPNAPWARLGCSDIVDLDGRGTSAATPQVAAAAALWIQRHRADWEKYPQAWMCVEAVRRALFDSAVGGAGPPDEHLGRGILHANDALSKAAADPASLRMEAADDVSFALLRLLSGLGIAAAAPDARWRMLELEALQLSQQSHDVEALLADAEEHGGELSTAARQRLIELLHDAPGASRALRAELAQHVAPVAAPRPSATDTLTPVEALRLRLAIDPPSPPPAVRALRVFAFDPVTGYSTATQQLNETTLEIRWERLEPGPVGEYLEVVDVDPATGCCYAPVDLDHPTPLSQAGLPPSEANPRFHQQMVYAVAMKTIAHFEQALGRVALWAPRFVKYRQAGRDRVERHYVQRLRIYPHALREANAFYSPAKKALLLGYFPAAKQRAGDNLPGGTIFCALSHDIIAHETTHALLDGLHRYFAEPTNEDVLAFHEAFADIVALFQHFSLPRALEDQIRATRGDLSKQNLLADLALQFGQGIGRLKALRSAIGQQPDGTEYQNATEAHARGAVLVAAVFDAFQDIYRRRSADLIRLATSGTGVLPAGEIPYDLVSRLAVEASKVARHVLSICIRALDYCPPVDLRFGEYVRALITADRDLVPQDRWAYRTAFVQGFRRRGIYPENVRNLSSESLCWESPEVQFPLEEMFAPLQLSWNLDANRRDAYELSQRNGLRVWHFFKERTSDEDTESLGFFRHGKRELNGQPGTLREFEVHSVRPVRRIGPDRQQRTDLVVEITQSWIPADGSGKFRGGCTLIIDLDRRRIRYVVRKKVGHADRMSGQAAFQARMAADDLASNYFDDPAGRREPFAFMHRSIGEVDRDGDAQARSAEIAATKG